MLPIQTKTAIQIGVKTYEFSYPNVGQIIEIENVKILLSGNTYGDLVKSNHKTAIELLNLIDGVAYFTTLNEDFKKDFNIVEFTTMEVVNQRLIMIGFVKFWKWLNQIETEINKLTSEADGSKDDQNK